MEYFTVYVKNLERQEDIELPPTETLETLVSALNNKIRFPSNANVRIQSEGSEYDIQTPLNEVLGKKLVLSYVQIVPLKFSHPYLKDTTIDTNVLGTQLQLESVIKSQLPMQYNVRLIESNEDWGLRLSQKILYEVLATFFIFYQEDINIFTIDVFETCETIKNYVKIHFSIRRPFQLQYNGLILEDKELFYQFLIPDNSQLKIVFIDKVSIKVDFQGKQKSYNLSRYEGIHKFKLFLRKQYGISEGIEFSLEKQNQYKSNARMEVYSVEEFYNNQVIYIKLLDYELKLYLQLSDQPLQFATKVQSNQKIESLDTNFVCQNKKAKYFLDQIELDKTRTFKDYFKQGEVKTIKIVLPNYNDYEITFQNKYFPRQSFKIKITTNQTIEEGIASLIPQKQEFTVFYNNAAVNPKMKFQEIGIKDQDQMSFYLHIVNVGASFDLMLNYYDINLNWTGKQIKEFFGKKLKISNFQLLYDEAPFPLDSKFESLYQPDIIFQIEITKLSVKIEIPAFLTNATFEFDQKLRIFDVKEKLRKHFDIPDSVGVFITYEDIPQPDNVQLESLDLESYSLSADFQSEIDISFINQKGALIRQIKVGLGDQLKQALQGFYNLEKVQCFHNDNLINIEKTFLDLKVQQNDKIQIVENSMSLIFRNKGSFIDINLFVNPKDTLRNSFNQISLRQAKFYIDNIQLDQDRTIMELAIRDNQIIQYESLINVIFTRIKGSLICTRVVSVNTLLVNALKGVCNAPVWFFYNNNLTDQNLSFNQLTNQDELAIAFEEKQQQITVFDELQQIKISVNINLALKDVAKRLKLNTQLKSFYEGEQFLEYSTKLYSLFNEDNEIVLYFRAANNPEQSLFLPSQMIKLNNLKIILIDEQTETRYNETIENKSVLVKEFIDQFQKKSGLEGVMLFYEGVELEEKKSFDQLKIPDEAEIELQY